MGQIWVHIPTASGSVLNARLHAELVKRSRKLAYRDAISTLMADEFQFATGSESANARVAQMLLSLGYIGVPFVFAANYSLIRRLLRRPSEEQQRLLSNPIVFLPDTATSIDWQSTLEAQRDVAPDFFVFDPVKDAERLHAYSAGRKRAMAKLLLLAFRARYARQGKVDFEAIRHAYHSCEYACYREEAEILAAQAIQGRANPKRNDLWCPLPITETVSVAFLNSAITAMNELEADAELSAALSPGERREVALVKRDVKKQKLVPGQVVPLRKRSTATATDLKRNVNLYRDSL